MFYNIFLKGFKITLSKADLSGADLSGVNLSGNNFRNANLSGINLSGADLSGVDLCDSTKLESVYRGIIEGLQECNIEKWDNENTSRLRFVILICDSGDNKRGELFL